MSGRSAQHVTSLAHNLLRDLSKHYIPILGVDGLNSGCWVVVDLNNVIVHIFLEETRQFYDLEKMWTIPNLSK